MAQENPTFNLLYKVEAQKTFVDKLYDFLIGPARLIIVGVMVVILSVFGYRFFLDATLRDEKKKTEQYKNSVESIVIPNEKTHRGILSRTEDYAKYIALYRNPSTSTPADEGKLHFLSVNYEQIMSIRSSKYLNNLTIAEYSVTNEPLNTIVRITGAASTFLTVDQFVNDIKKLDTVADASSTNLGSTRQQIPRYQIDIKLKN